MSISESSVAPSQLSSTSSDASNQITGTVTKVSQQTVSVAIDNEDADADEQLNDMDTYKLVKLCNDVTYKRIKSALQQLKSDKLSARASHLSDVLFGNVKPDSQPASARLELNFFNKRLDASQQEAVRLTFEQKDVAIIHGPPGTGKTTTLVEVIKQHCIVHKQRVLVCAPSNIAVDNLVERLIPASSQSSSSDQLSAQQRVRMVRLGHPARLLEHIQEYSLDSVVSRSEQYKLAGDIKRDMDTTLKAMRKSGTQRGERDSLRRELRELRKDLYEREDRAVKSVMQAADCVLATLTTTQAEGPLRHLSAEHFDVLIIDECSQAMEAACWIAIVRGARKLVLAGDHLQLPPTIVCKEAATGGLELTLMKRLLDDKERTFGQCVRMLTVQYRMNEAISRWVADRLYESRLVAHESVRAHLLSDLRGVASTSDTSVPLVVIDTHGCDMSEMMMISSSNHIAGDDNESKANDGEANLVCRHVHALVESGLPAEAIAVITPYNLQVELIKAKLHPKYPLVEVKSVDGFQGRGW